MLGTLQQVHMTWVTCVTFYGSQNHPLNPQEGKVKQALTEHRAPSLVDDVQANRAGHLVHVGVEHAVFEANRGRFEGIFLGQSHVDFPDPSLVGRCVHISECESEIITTSASAQQRKERERLEQATEGHMILYTVQTFRALALNETT